MLKFAYILFVFLVGTGSGMAQSGFSLSGNLRLLESVEVKVTSIFGEKLLSCIVENGKAFRTETVNIQPDVYLLYIGETSQPIYLSNSEVTINGFYDAKNIQNTSLNFEGIDDYWAISNWIPREKIAKNRIVSPDVKGKLKGNMYSALAFMANMVDYESNKMLLELVPESERNSASASWLAQRVDSLRTFAIGAMAYDFECVNPSGKKVKLSDFRGKFVLVDFWASWCGPCRAEMKNLLPIYDELKRDDLEFISVSLDRQEKDWRRMLEVERLPWVMLWNKEGFVIGDEPNTIQKMYGFYGIPFIVLISKEGKILARTLRGEQVKEVILKARKGEL